MQNSTPNFSTQFLNLIPTISNQYPNLTSQNLINQIIKQLITNPQYNQTLLLLQKHLNTTNPTIIKNYLNNSHIQFLISENLPLPYTL